MSAIPAAFPEPGLAWSVWKLLRLRLVIIVNGFRRAKTATKIGYIVAGIGILALVAFILFISISLLGFLNSPQLAQYLGKTTSFLESFPTMIVSLSAIGILLTSFGVLLQALYLSGDMDFLMSAPIPIRAVFISKLVQAVLPNFIFMCLLTLPILFGLGISSGYNFLYYPLAVIVLTAISLAAASLASLLVMVVARYFPARRVAEVLGFIIGAFFLVFSQSARFMNFDINDQQVTGMLNMTGRFNRPWSPLAWSGQGLVDLGKGNWLPAIGLLAASLITTGLIFFAALAVSERLYYNGWSSLQNNRRKAKARPGAPARQAALPRAQSPWIGFIPAPVRAILVKDLLVYRRDLRNASQLITPLILGVVYAISLLRSGGSGLSGKGEAPAWFMGTVNSLMIYADIALALFLGWNLVANLVGLGFSQEGKNYWILKAAPIKARQLLTAKFLVGYLPAMLICNLYVLVLQIFKGASPWSMILSMLAVSMILAGLSGIYLYFGTRGAKFDWENPSQMNRAVGCLGTIVCMLFLPLGFLLFIGPTFLAGLLGLPLVAGQLAGLLLGGGASAAAMLIPIGLVEKRVATLAEA